MIKYLLITFLCFLLNSVSLAKHQNEPYEPNGWDKFLVKGSQNYYKFQFSSKDLISSTAKVSFL